MSELIHKLEKRTATIVVIGVGYVGLPLAVAFAQEGFTTIGLDKDEGKVEALGRGDSYIADVPSADLEPLVSSGKLRASCDPAVIAEADAVVVCVPTPLNKIKAPNLRYVIEATDQIAQHQHPDMLIVLESTTYPGTTAEVMVPRLSGRRLELGRDVFVAFSPERVDPRNPVYHTRNTPKVVGGSTPACLRVALALYESVIDTLVPVSSTDTAEMVKLLENTYRAVNIALANEFALMAGRLGVDVWEAIDAASTKPFGFMPFYPGPGLGGHCIPIDPLYLSWRMRSLKYQARFIELADVINSAMPDHVVALTQQALNSAKKSINGSKLLISGVAYKRDVPDHRESPAFAIFEALEQLGAELSYLDPLVPKLDEPSWSMESVGADVAFGDYDAVVIVTDHEVIDYARMLDEAQLIVDTRNALQSVEGDHSKVTTLGARRPASAGRGSHEHALESEEEEGRQEGPYWKGDDPGQRDFADYPQVDARYAAGEANADYRAYGNVRGRDR